MRKALVVGIDYYAHFNGLYGCVRDAHSVSNVLERNSNGDVNFAVELVTATNAGTSVSRGSLKDRVIELFKGKSEIALLYFAGHGHIEPTGGYLCTSECGRGDEGLALGEVLQIAHGSQARNKVIVLDSCHSGIAGANPIAQQFAELSDGMTILTASTEAQYADEVNGSGVFTALFVDALQGAAGNLVGDVTPGSVYAHIDQSLGPWQQRPVFKTNVQTFVSLRRVQPPLPLEELRRLPDLFPAPGFEFQLDPSFEPEPTGRPAGAAPPNASNTAKFVILQKYNRVNLVVPIGASQPNMWHAAIESKACKLTVLGEHYRRLVAAKLI